MFHGNADNIGYTIPLAWEFHTKLKCNVLMLSPRGYTSLSLEGMLFSNCLQIRFVQRAAFHERYLAYNCYDFLSDGNDLYLGFKRDSEVGFPIPYYTQDYNNFLCHAGSTQLYLLSSTIT